MSTTPTPAPTKKPNVLVRLADGVEIEAEKLLSLVRKGEILAPKLSSVLGVILGATDKAISDVQADAANPVNLLNIQLDKSQAADVIAVWTDFKTEAAALGIKI